MITWNQKLNSVVCECGCKMEITSRMAAQVLGSVSTAIKANAVRENAKRPRPTARKPRREKTLWENLVELPFEERVLIIEAAKCLPRPRKRGRPKKSDVSE